MTNGKYVNLDTIIEKVYKLSPPQAEISRDDIVEWIWEAVSKIGAVSGNFIDMFAYIVIEDYRARLPYFFKAMKQVSYVVDNVDLIETPEVLEQYTRFLMTTTIENWYKDRQLNSNNVSKGYRYNISNGYINTTFDKGILELCFTSFPIDEKGEPLVQENVYIIEAIIWYIVKTLLYRMWIRNPMYGEQFKYAEQKWDFYVNAARSDMQMMSEDERTAFSNKHLRIIPADLQKNGTGRYFIRPTVNRELLNKFVLCPYQTV